MHRRARNRPPSRRRCPITPKWNKTQQKPAAESAAPQATPTAAANPAAQKGITGKAIDR